MTLICQATMGYLLYRMSSQNKQIKCVIIVTVQRISNVLFSFFTGTFSLQYCAEFGSKHHNNGDVLQGSTIYDNYKTLDIYHKIYV